MSEYFWCTAGDFGAETVLDRGGYYEQIDERGQPVQRPGGFATSDVPEVCLSKSPEACLFALAHNVEDATTLRIYRTTQTPNIDISMAGWDFGVLEEVRYRDPLKDPVGLTYCKRVDLPQRAFEDATESYNPHGPYGDPPQMAVDTPESVFHRGWAEAVKDALSGVLDGRTYPEYIAYESEYDDYFE